MRATSPQRRAVCQDLLLHLSRGLRDDELHVLAVTAKRIIGDAIAAGNRLELLAAQQSLIHTIAPMMHTYCEVRAIKVVGEERRALRSSIALYRDRQCSAIAKMGLFNFSSVAIY